MDKFHGDNGATAEVTAQAAVFGNHLILENILQHLSTANLRTFQAVNKLWNHVASKIMKNERLLKAQFSYKTSPDVVKSGAVTNANLATVYEWDFGDIVRWKNQDLANLKANIEALNSIIAEDTTGKLAAGVALKIQYFSSILNIHGLNMDTPLISIVSSFETIVCSVRNLAVLTLDLAAYCTDILHGEQGQKLQNQQLPHLEQITFILKSSRLYPPYKAICKLIMNAAPNLKVIKGASISSIWDTILECGKAPCVKSYTIEQQEPTGPCTGAVLRDLHSLIEHTPAVESLVLNDFSLNCYDKLNEQRILDAWWTAIRILLLYYQKSLRCIQTTQLSFLDYFIERQEDSAHVPVFENLEFLNFTTVRPHQLLPQVSVAENHFPCLTRVKLELKGLTGCRLAHYFPTGGVEDPLHWTLPTVRELELSNHYDKKGMEILGQVFPNVKKIKFYQVIGNYTHSFRNGLWNMPPSVEWVTLHFMAKYYRKKLGNLDELFTGIRKQTLAKLPRDVAQDAYLKIASRNGVRKLKGLKRLIIIFDMDESQILSPFNPFYGVTKTNLRDSINFPFFLKKGTFTALSGLFAFSSPDFKTEIHYDPRVHCATQIEKLIQNLQPNVIAAPSHRSQLNSQLIVDLAALVRQKGVEVEDQPLSDNVPALA